MTKRQKGDVAEQAAILQQLKRGWGILRPVGDSLPYDLVYDIGGALVRVQVKSAWLDPVKGNYVIDNRRTKTNRRQMVRSPHRAADFDFCLAYLKDLDLFYVFPVEVFIAYGSAGPLICLLGCLAPHRCHRDDIRSNRGFHRGR